LEIRYLLKNNILFKHFVAGGSIGTSNAYCTLVLTHLRGWLAQKKRVQTVVTSPPQAHARRL